MVEDLKYSIYFRLHTDLSASPIRGQGSTRFVRVSDFRLPFTAFNAYVAGYT